MKKSLRVALLAGSIFLMSSPVFAGGPGGTDPPPPPGNGGTGQVVISTAVSVLLGYLL